jgi:hypothetical protein
MAIKVTKASNGLYIAQAVPPDLAEEWSTLVPNAADDLVHELFKRGAHQTDIGDAIYEADRDWLKREGERVTNP